VKKHLYCLTIWFGLLLFGSAGCTFAGEDPVTLPIVTSTTPPPTVTITPVLMDTTTATLAPMTPSATLPPTHTSTPTPASLVLPAITMSPQEAEAALLELLKTNGNCTGKCVAGIWPDEMNVQEAVDVMARWGTINIVEDFEGDTFIHLVQTPLEDQVFVKLSIGTWTKELETIDEVSFNIMVPSGDSFASEDLWLVNRENWQGFQLDSILETYGIPSYVGFFFQTTVEIGSPLEGRTIHYGLDLHYEDLNLIAGIGAMAYYNGETLFICPSKDPHGVGIDINPERSLEKLEEFRPVTWEALTGTDLEAFYRMFTDETNPDACITTTLEQIQALQPSFR